MEMIHMLIAIIFVVIIIMFYYDYELNKRVRNMNVLSLNEFNGLDPEIKREYSMLVKDMHPRWADVNKDKEMIIKQMAGLKDNAMLAESIRPPARTETFVGPSRLVTKGEEFTSSECLPVQRSKVESFVVPLSPSKQFYTA